MHVAPCASLLVIDFSIMFSIIFLYTWSYRQVKVDCMNVFLTMMVQTSAVLTHYAY